MYKEAAKVIDKFAKENFPGVLFETALVLGSGLGNFPKRFENAKSISYKDISGFPVSTAPGHEGKLFLTVLGGKGVYLLSGRTHYYEGLGMAKVIFATRVMAVLGVKNMFLTNASGGVNKAYTPGDLMLFTDHINSLPNPLIGENDSSFGVRFPDMTNFYVNKLSEKVEKCASELKIKLQKGVYYAMQGPSYETPAEIRMIRTVGGDAVGMSTVPEAIAARHAGMTVCAISLVSNYAAGLNSAPLTEKEVIDAGNAASEKFGSLMEKVITEIHSETK